LQNIHNPGYFKNSANLMPFVTTVKRPEIPGPAFSRKKSGAVPHHIISRRIIIRQLFEIYPGFSSG